LSFQISRTGIRKKLLIPVHPDLYHFAFKRNTCRFLSGF
jgi:hypothetical protein